MFSFFKRSKSQKSKQKQERKQQPALQQHDGNALKVAPSGACVSNTSETQPTPSPTEVLPPLLVPKSAGGVRDAESGGELRATHKSVKNKPHSPPTATCFSPSDIIRENGCSLALEDNSGGVIEFADEDTDEEITERNAINERVQREDLRVRRGETSDPTSEQSSSSNQNATPLESAMAKGRNKKRYHQQQHQNQGGKNCTQPQQGQKQSNLANNVNLLHKEKKNSEEKVQKVNVENVIPPTATTVTVTKPTENVNAVQKSASEVNHDEHISKEETKVNPVGEEVGFEQKLSCLSDVNGNHIEEREDKNSLGLRSVCDESSLNDHPDPRGDRDGVCVIAENQTACNHPPTTDQPTTTSPLPLTNTAVDADVNELLGGSEPQCPATELYSSAIATPRNIDDDGLHEKIDRREIVASEEVPTDKEMGQQPSKPNEVVNSSRRSPHYHHQQQLILQVIQDAPRDDISDDRDIFYEATESLSPTLSPTTENGDKTEPFSPLKTIISSSQNASRASPKKRVVFSDQVLINGEPCQEYDLRNTVSVSESAESLPSALNLEQQSYEQVAEYSDDELMHDGCSPGSLVNTNNDNGVNLVLSVGNNEHQHAFNSDNSGISPCVPSFIANQKLIEFQYDHSDPRVLQNGHAEDEEKTKHQSQPVIGNEDFLPIVVENGLVGEDTISLPDVVQPTSIEKASKQPFNTVDKINSEMKELVNQESRYSAKLEEAEKRASEAQTRAYELQLRLTEVERDVSLKECNVDRLKAEVEAAYRECEGIRGRLRTQDAEMVALRLKSSDREDELNLKYQNLEIEMLELNEKLKEVRQLAHELNIQLIDAKAEADALRKERDKLLEERTDEQKIIKEALELSLKERAQVEAKWRHDFEELRTVHSEREEHLMVDCEWKIRSMQKNCKEKIETVERERKIAMDKMVKLEQDSRKYTEEVKHLRSYEAEVAQLRGLTYDQKEALTTMTRQVDQLKAEVVIANHKLESEIVKVQQIKNRCEYQMCEKEREALQRIEIARGEIAMQWEDRLLHEMNRLKSELEQTYMEERVSAINKIKKEALEETEALTNEFHLRERQLKEEIDSLKATLQKQRQAMENAQSEADNKLLQARMFVERADRDHEAILSKEVSKREQVIENLKEQCEKEKQEMEKHFSFRIQQVQEEFARELADTTEMLKLTHKKELEQQWKQLVSEKEEALQLMESRHRTRLEEAEIKISFEEMRKRYERREPRQEDLQQIEELKSIIESQDRDLRILTERFRELQLQEREQQQQHPAPQPPRRVKNRGKQQQNQPSEQSTVDEEHQQQSSIQTAPMVVVPVPIVCDVIYEENEADLMDEEQEEHQQQTEKIHVVDVPESAIQTETTIVQSTEPVFIESAASSATPVIAEADVQCSPTTIEQEGTPGDPQVEITVIQSDQIPECQQEIPAPMPPAPTIIITREPDDDSVAGDEDSTEVTISPVIEVSTVQSNSAETESTPPAEPRSDADTKVQNTPDIPPTPVTDADQVVTEVTAADEVVVVVGAECEFDCTPGPRSAST
ncbi:uncharacterized protein LOC129767186 isoform X2 [Toxorhynchites rutilus septentrionalis]|uniref:uncharacterized protein LOC129767186 isoform X2 n=1 Tax=Toxorhynchites rutilus septentrionalis TaxID=329112 RepID=UPI002479D112|nr:uncharacterized protein LOC129767186 isoform X2 [Toxorhynchites rutilus septentrionalis]